MLEKVFDFFIWLGIFLGDVLEFGLKAIIIVIAFALCVKILQKIKPSLDKRKIKIENLKEKYEKYENQFYHKTLNKKELKNYLIQKKASHSKKKSFWKKGFSKSSTKELSLKKSPKLFVLSFKGDIMASEVKHLREEISLIIKLFKKEDEVVLLLNSRGGSVSHYGLAANQLQRLRNNQIPLTVCVDEVAGSGGYLMACIGNKILASPFAMVGSIGVFCGVPNIHDFLKKNDISYEEFTAGKYKRTVTPMGKVTEEKKKQLQEQLNLVHTQFKNFVKKYRNINLEEVATGEVWLAEEALKKGLVDQLKCSDDFILEKIKSHQVYKISFKKEKTLLDKLPKMNLLQKNMVEDFFRQDLII
ncbi:MAG: protease SohB [Bdellovibrionales bacterium]|nr:protease SohB [Bdellovibrionales bacterium]